MRKNYKKEKKEKKASTCSLSSKHSCNVPVRRAFPHSGSMLIGARAKPIKAGGHGHHPLHH